MKAVEQLEQARQAIEAVIDALNEQTDVCERCGVTHYQDRDEFQAAQSLRGIAEKLKRLAGQRWAGKEWEGR